MKKSIRKVNKSFSIFKEKDPSLMRILIITSKNYRILVGNSKILLREILIGILKPKELKDLHLHLEKLINKLRYNSKMNPRNTLWVHQESPIDILPQKMRLYHQILKFISKNLLHTKEVKKSTKIWNLLKKN